MGAIIKVFSDLVSSMLLATAISKSASLTIAMSGLMVIARILVFHHVIHDIVHFDLTYRGLVIHFSMYQVEDSRL